MSLLKEPGVLSDFALHLPHYTYILIANILTDT